MPSQAMQASNALNDVDRQLIDECRRAVKSKRGNTTGWDLLFWFFLVIACLTTVVVVILLIVDGTVKDKGIQSMFNGWFATVIFWYVRRSARRHERVVALVAKLSAVANSPP